MDISANFLKKEQSKLISEVLLQIYFSAYDQIRQFMVFIIWVTMVILMQEDFLLLMMMQRNNNLLIIQE